MSVVYPLFVLLDDQTMMTIDSPNHILSDLEGIDIENGEYRFWDSTERPVRVTVEMTNAFISSPTGRWWMFSTASQP